jgi:hypothetical protein
MVRVTATHASKDREGKKFFSVTFWDALCTGDGSDKQPLTGPVHTLYMLIGLMMTILIKTYYNYKPVFMTSFLRVHVDYITFQHEYEYQCMSKRINFSHV